MNSKMTIERLERKIDALKRALVEASQDDLTGLLRRKAFTESVTRALEHHKRYKRNFVLLFVDVNDFGLTNKIIGRKAGDTLLKEIAEFLLQEVRKVDIMGKGRVGRDGGDEFAILLPGQTHAGGEKVRKRLMNAFKKKSFEYPVAGLSIGIASTSLGIKDIEQLYAVADEDMRAQKPKKQLSA